MTESWSYGRNIFRSQFHILQGSCNLFIGAYNKKVHYGFYDRIARLHKTTEYMQMWTLSKLP